MKPIISFLILFFPFLSTAQNVRTIKVIDSKTKSPLPGVHVLLNGEPTAIESNFYGYFQIELPLTDSQLTLFDYGYDSLSFIPPEAERFTVALDQKVLNIFKSGMTEYYRMWANKVVFPITAAKKGLNGITILLFEIDNKGRMINQEIINSLSYDIDQQILSAAQDFKDGFIPHYGSQKYLQPFFFKLPDRHLQLPDLALPDAELLSEIVFSLSARTSLKIRR